MEHQIQIPNCDNLTLIRSGPEGNLYGAIFKNKGVIVKVFFYGYDKWTDGQHTKAAQNTKLLGELLPKCVPKVHFIHKTKEFVAIVMENILGITLCSFIKKKETDLRIIHKVITSLVESVFDLHSVGYVHGDLHQSNVLITTDYQVKLIDFYLLDKVDAVDESDMITPKINMDYLELKVHVANILFPQLPEMSIADTVKSIKNYTAKDVVGYDDNQRVATKLYAVLECFKDIDCED